MLASPNINHGTGLDQWVFLDDFNVGLDNNTTTGLGRWLFLETAAGAAQIIDIANSFGVLKLTQTTNDNDVISMQANAGIRVDQCKSGAPVQFGCRFQTADVDDVDLHMGLSIQDVSMTASVPADFIAFRVQEGSAALQLVISKDSVLTTVTGICTLVDATWVRAFFTYTPTSTPDIGDVVYEVHTNGGVYRGTVGSAGNFPDDVVIAPTIQVQNGSTDADATYVDWIYATAERVYTAGTG